MINIIINIINKERPLQLVATILLLLAAALAMLSQLAFAAEDNTTSTSLSTTTTISKSDASFLISKIERNITSLKEAGYSTERLDDSLAEMNLLYQSANYEEVQEAYTAALSLIGQMLYQSELIKKQGVLLDEARKRNLNITEAQIHYTKGTSEFKNNNIEGAKESLEKSNELLIKVLKEESSKVIAELRNMAFVLAQQGIESRILNLTSSKVADAERKDDFVSIFLLANSLGKINSSIMMIIEVQAGRDSLEKEGFSTARMDDALRDMKSLLDEEQHEELERLYNSTEAMIRKIPWLKVEIEGIEEKMASPEMEGIDFSEAMSILELARQEFGMENYERSEDYLSKAKEAVESAESANILTAMLNKAKLRFNIFDFLKKNWLIIILLAGTAYASIKIAIFLIQLERWKKERFRLQEEEKAINELMKKLQMDYFKEKSIDKETYDSENNDYEKRLSEIAKERPLLEANIAEREKKITEAKKKLSKKPAEKRKK